MKRKYLRNQLTRIFSIYGRRPFFIRRKVKDRLFRFIFSKDKKALLQLYNALNGTDYTNPDDLEITTVESVLYMSMKNDLSFVLYGILNLYEHQGSFNPNMPLRFLLYLAQQYQQLVEERGENIYGTKLIKLPLPQCVVFYNGTAEVPDEQVLRLSDSFETSGKESSVELTVRMININFGHNAELMDKCKRLYDYAIFIDLMQKNLHNGMSLRRAVDDAALYCIDHDILADFLGKYRAEVTGMLLTEYNERKYRKLFRKEAREEGLAEGRAEGREAGLAEGREAGLTEGRISVISSLLDSGVSEQEVCRLAKCSPDEVKMAKKLCQDKKTR